MKKLKDFFVGFVPGIVLPFFQLLFLGSIFDSNITKLIDVLSVIIFIGFPLGFIGLTMFFIFKKRKFISLGIIAGLIVGYGLMVNVK